MIGLDEVKLQVKCLVQLVNTFKYSISIMAPEGWQKDYLRNMCKTIVDLQRSILTLDTYRKLLRYLPLGQYKSAMSALSFDVYLAFRKSVAQHQELIDNTFLFVE